jgi:phage terminase large subunit GpA-like protein
MDPGKRKANLQWATRLMKTSTIVSLIGWTADQDPVPMACLFPDQKILDNALTEQFYPVLEETRCTKKQLPPGHQRNRRVIRFAGCSLRLANAGSVSDSSGYPALRVFKMEHEKTPLPSSGDIETDASRRIEKRTSGYSRWVKILEEGSPVKAGSSRVHKLRRSLNVQIFMYHVPCPHCGEYQALEFSRVKWDRDELGNHNAALAERTAVYLCAHCEKRIENHHRVQMMRAGRWLSDGEWCDGAGNICGKPKNLSDTCVFGPLSKLYSLLISGWGAVAKEFVEAIEAQKNGDLQALANFIMETLGEVFDGTPVEVPTSDLAEHLRGSHNRGTCPPETQFLTTAADVGYAGSEILFHWMVVAWARACQGYVIDWGLSTGAEQFMKFLQSTFPVSLPRVRPLPLLDFPVGLDSSKYTDEVYDITDQITNGIAMKGDSRNSAAAIDLYRWGVRRTDVSPKLVRLRRDLGMGDLMLVNSEKTQLWREGLMAKRINPGMRGYVCLPGDVCQDWESHKGFFEQFVADYKEKNKWRRFGANEAGDQIRLSRVLAEYYTKNGALWDSVALPQRFRIAEGQEVAGVSGRADRPAQANVFHQSPFLLSQR